MCGGGGDSDGLLISCCVDQPTSPVADAGKKTEQQRAPLATADPGAAHRTAKLTYMPRELVAEPRSIDLQVHSLLHAPSTLLALVLATTRAPQVKGGAGGEATESRCSGTIAGKTPTAEEEATCKACGPGRGTGPGGETGTGGRPRRSLRRASERELGGDERYDEHRAEHHEKHRGEHGGGHGGEHEHHTASTTASTSRRAPRRAPPRTVAITTASTAASTSTRRGQYGEHRGEMSNTSTTASTAARGATR